MLRQIVLVSLVFLLSYSGFVAMDLPLAGQAAIVLAALTAAWCVRGEPGGVVSALGLGRPLRPWAVLPAGLGVALLGYAVAVVTLLLATRVFGWAPPEVSRLAAIQGNLPMLLLMLAVVWSTVALGEELLYRGFLLGRLRRLFGTTRCASLSAVTLQGLLFGLSHAYQGATGILVTASIGLVFGLLALRCRTLWPLVVGHGIVDTVSLVALYAGALPGA